ncbi:hypothetical protein BT67DRAFT_438237, partial [Trichocladium antarcticum]
MALSVKNQVVMRRSDKCSTHQLTAQSCLAAPSCRVEPLSRFSASSKIIALAETTCPVRASSN